MIVLGIPTSALKCLTCGTYWRPDQRETEATALTDSAEYVCADRSARIKMARNGLFNQVFRSVDGAIPARERDRAVLDIGCSFGFLLDVFERNGWQGCGVERVARLRDEIQRKGIHQVFESIEKVPVTSRFEAVTLIDSLYYFTDPRGLLDAIYPRLAEGGVVVVRVTNRTPLLNLVAVLRNRLLNGHVFGDQVVAFSHRGIDALARRTGFRVASVTGWESRPIQSFGGVGLFVAYKFFSLLSALSRKHLSLGLVYVLVKGLGTRE
ncbi:MAG: class I SAM-dependent methyltransferase [Fimbriimonas sp.]